MFFKYLLEESVEVKPWSTISVQKKKFQFIINQKWKQFLRASKSLI